MNRTTTLIILYVLLALTVTVVLAVPHPQASGVTDTGTGGNTATPDAGKTNDPSAVGKDPTSGTDLTGKQPTGDSQGQPSSSQNPSTAPTTPGTGQTTPDPNANPTTQPSQQPDQQTGDPNNNANGQNPGQDQGQGQGQNQDQPAQQPPADNNQDTGTTDPGSADPSGTDPAQQSGDPTTQPTQDDSSQPSPDQSTPDTSVPEQTSSGDGNGNGGGDSSSSGSGGDGASNGSSSDGGQLSCTSNEECESGNCQNGTCAAPNEGTTSDNKSEGGSKVGKSVGISVGVIFGLAAVAGLGFWMFRRMNQDRDVGNIYRNSGESFNSAGLAAIPGLDDNSSSLTFERRRSNVPAPYAFSAPQAGFVSSEMEQQSQSYRLSLNYGSAGAGGFGGNPMTRNLQDYNEGYGYAPEAQHVTPPMNGLPTISMTPPAMTMIQEPEALNSGLQANNPVPPAQPAGSVDVVYPAVDPEQVVDKQKVLAAAVKTLTPTANSGLLRRNDSKKSANTRDSIASDGSSRVATNSVYIGVDYGFMEDEEDDSTPAGRYRMNSMYSTYSHDSMIFGQDAPPIKPITNLYNGSSSSTSKPATSAGSSEVSVSQVPRSSVFTLHAPIFKEYQASSEGKVPPVPSMPNKYANDF